MMKTIYQDIATKLSEQLAEVFWAHEDEIATRARLIDAEIAEITRQIGLEATQKILTHALEQEVKKNGIPD
jgi:hypothetical protein